jgi:predicted acylesterase/phospholipase RssA
MFDERNSQSICIAARTACVIALLAIVVGCAAPPRMAAVPDGRAADAIVPGIEGARVYVLADTQSFIGIAEKSVEREQAAFEAAGHSGALPPANYLSISGGGDNGAFGTGLLLGWTAQGDRPEFKLVTGVSTGALIAPFAFLGTAYDARLKEVFTSVAPDDIYETRNIFFGIFGDGLADNAPLFRLVAEKLDQQMLDAIGAEYEKGRILLIATTNLDAQQPVIWNIGEIAVSNDPKRLQLIHKIMVASAAIPGAFPPVMFDVEVDGKLYQEMHVDGGTSTQAFVYPASLNPKELLAKQGLVRQRNLYIIRNSRLDADWASVERSTLDIVGRSIASLINFQGIGDLYRMYAQTEKDGVDYNLAFIKPEFTDIHIEEFDTAYMRKLFAYGFEKSKDGYPWRKFPPGFDPDQ